MKDNKLTDNEIKKAFEECFVNRNCVFCDICPYNNGMCDDEQLVKDTLDLINRLQAENERLKYFNSANVASAIGLENKLETAKAEAYKECIERVYKFICDTQNWGVLHREFLENGECYWLKQKFNNLLKELVGENND